MDWNKYFNTPKDPKDKHNFKKFDYEEDDDDFSDLETFFNEFSKISGNTFNFEGFPPSMLKQFQEVLEAMEGLHRGDDNENRQKLAEKYFEFKERRDNDLDDKIYADQLDSLLKRMSPDLMLKDEQKQIVQQPTRKLTDEEIVMDKIHGTFKEVVKATPKRPAKKGQVHKAPMSPHHFGALPPFHEFPPSQGRTWGKTVISIRKPDGSSETRRMERTPEGSMKTTITKTDSEGHSSTQTFMGDEQIAAGGSDRKIEEPKNFEERNLINYNGYKIPCLF